MKAENRHDIAEKKIVSDPIPVEWDFISKYMRGSVLKRLDDERMVMSQTYIGWIELGLVIFTSYLYMYMMSGVNERVDEQFKLDYETATQEQFYSLKFYTDSLGMTDLKLVERNPNKDELEIINRYRELGEKDTRVVMHLHPALAPYKCAVLPLSKKLNENAEKVYHMLQKRFMVEYDDAGSIGKRYRRQDEIGTPFCLTYDFDSETDGCVTVRDRDTMAQERVAIDKLAEYIEAKLEF